MISDLPENIKGRATTPDVGHLFEMNVESYRKIIEEEWATALHHAVAQLMLAAPQDSKEIQTSITLLSKRVRDTERYDW